MESRKKAHNNPVDVSRRKELGIVTIVALYTIVFFGIAALSFRGQQEWTVSFGSWLGVAGIVWVAIFALASALLAPREIAARTLAVIPSLTLIAFGGIDAAAVAGAVLLLGLTLGAQSSIIRELESHIKIRTATVFSFGVRLLFFAMLLSFIVLAIPVVREAIANGSVQIPSEYITGIAEPALPALRTINPSYVQDDIASRVNEYIRSRANNDSILVTIVVMAIALLAIRAVVPIIASVALACIAILFWSLRKAGVVSVVEHEEPVQSITL